MTTRRRLRAPRLLPLTTVGVAAALLASGLAAGPASAETAASADAAATGLPTQADGSAFAARQKTERETRPTGDAATPIVLSGSIVVSGADEAHPAPGDAGYRLTVENDAGEKVQELVTGSAFSVTVPGGRNYYLKAEALAGSSWYPVWYGDDTPVLVEAAPLAATTADLTITLPRRAPVSGNVTAAAVPGVATTALEVEAWWYEAGSSTFYELGEADASGAPTIAVPWSIGGDSALPAGTYAFRAGEDGYPRYDDQWAPGISRLQDRALTTVAAEGRSGINFAPTVYGSSTRRDSGDDRYETAAKITQTTFTGESIPVLYVASGEKWPDALSAGPAAAAGGGALLLTDPTTLKPVVSSEIRRLNPERIVVVGSNLSVSDGVFAGIDALTDAPVVRIFGDDRYATSRAIVADAFPAGSAETAFLATGGNFPDALSVAPIAGRLSQPVLLVPGAESAIDAATREAIDRLDPERSRLLGDLPSISKGVEDSLRSSQIAGTVDRIAGRDRQDTSRKLNEQYPAPATSDRVYLATAEGYADALSVGPVAAAVSAPLYLSSPTCLPRETRTALQEHDRDQVTLLGSRLTLSAALESLAIC